MHGELEHRIAVLQLRGVAGPLRARVAWPVATTRTPALVVFFPGGAERADALCSHADVVVVSVPPGDLADAMTSLEWAADHAAELDADPGRLLVAGERAGAALAAAVARQARDQEWPAIARQVLIRPDLAGLPAGSVAGVAPATVVTTGNGDDGRRYAARLRRAGVAVDELHHEGGPRERMLAYLARSLRRPLFDDDPEPGHGPPPALDLPAGAMRARE